MKVASGSSNPGDFTGSLGATLLGGVLQRGGLWAFVAGVLFFLAGAAEVASGLGLKIPQEVVSGFLYMAWGFAMAAIGSAGWHAKRATDMMARNGADAATDRAAILNAVTPDGITVVPQSSDPAVQHELDKRDAADAPIIAAASRKTPPGGTPIVVATGSQPRPNVSAP